VDRIGDTFRWKGENVATSEVESVLTKFPGISEITVYGVPIPNVPGNAGMASIVLTPDRQNSFDFKKFWELYEFCEFRRFSYLLFSSKEKLPSYACPLFLRICDEIKVTGTYKHQKAFLRKEGTNSFQIK
jgi:acyl-CoA synthetase (AMP-forming)/AMP-acid ligase II